MPSFLAKNLFHKDIPHEPTRHGYGKGVVAAATKNANVVVLCADLTESTRNADFKKQFPAQFIQMGVHEQLLAALAAGLALAGKIPFITSYAMFCPGRAWEQIRTTVCLQETNVKVIGSHTGVSVGPDGATHQAIEDMAIMRCIPHMTVISPCDVLEAEKATIAIAKHDGPCYVRYAREKSPVFTTKKTPFRIGRAEIFRPGKDVAIIACGPLVYRALKAAEELKKNGINAMVVNNHTIKPLDEKTIIAAAKKCGAVVTVEEHQVMGGMGSAVAECLAKNHPVPISFIGMQDRFGESGKPDELIAHFGMDTPDIVSAAKAVMKRKR